MLNIKEEIEDEEKKQLESQPIQMFAVGETPDDEEMTFFEEEYDNGEGETLELERDIKFWQAEKSSKRLRDKKASIAVEEVVQT